MKKKIILAVLVSFMFMGVVSAASMWGTYKGNIVIRILIDGKQIKEPAVPAISYGGKIMIPIDVLKQSGINYTYDKKNLTVNLILPKQPEVKEIPNHTPKLSAKDIYNSSVDLVGYVEAMDVYGNVACSGSGFMVAPGYFVTNHHVATCGNTGKVFVKISGKIYNNSDKAWFMFGNKDADLYGMILSSSYDSEGRSTGEVPPRYFNIVKTDLPEIGDKVYAIGSPLGLENTVSEGIVSGIRTLNGITLIQHTADTDHGSSGGALLDEEGYIIGVTSSGYDGTNLDFAIPISYVKNEIDRLSK